MGKKKDETPRCVIYAAPATRLVDGEPSCEGNVARVYEHQVEDHVETHSRFLKTLQVAEMDDHKVEAPPSEPAVLPPCDSCKHAADEHAGPDKTCRICGDRYKYPEEADLPSNVLLGE